ncbi:FAD-dependent oxidoreductase [Nocardia sp. NPDC051750]|uniref:hydroxysqualene dehydroxylase n=1 Tax=Nocardia sp. NPDC051750 TaxID=3364325 RepID=UPI00378F360F
MAESEVSRRSFVKGAAAGSIAVAAATATSSGLVGLTNAYAAPDKKKVAVLGGGIAGLTTAHELVERGFEVTVYERRAWGGKARSIDTPLPVAGGRKPLPGEHGFRFFPGYYQAIPDTMSRIPFEGNARGVQDNLVEALTATGAQAAPDITIPFALDFDAIGLAANPEKIIRTLLGGMIWLPKLPIPDLVVLLRSLLVFFTSSDERRLGQWEHTSFKDFVLMDGSNPTYNLLISTVTRALVAAKEEKASARTICNQAEGFLAAILHRTDGRFPDQVLNGPTNERWFNPWLAYLESQGVKFQMGTEIKSLEVADGKIRAAKATTESGDTDIEADWFVLAFAPEQVPQYLSPEILALDPDLERIKKLEVDWMNGIQFYLNTDHRFFRGHVGWIDSPWRLTGIQQGQFWTTNFADTYGDGNAKDCLSLCISDWEVPGQVVRKPAMECSPEEIAKEVWHQVTKAAQGEPLVPDLTDRQLHSWFLDPGYRYDPAAGKGTNEDYLMINTKSSWENRPTGPTKVPNLFLAGDYLKTEVDLATMEGACEGGRHAANAILDAAGSDAEKAVILPHPTLKEFEGARRLDAKRYAAGLPNLLDFKR